MGIPVSCSVRPVSTSPRSSQAGQSGRLQSGEQSWGWSHHGQQWQVIAPTGPGWRR